MLRWKGLWCRGTANTCGDVLAKSSCSCVNSESLVVSPSAMLEKALCSYLFMFEGNETPADF